MISKKNILQLTILTNLIFIHAFSIYPPNLDEVTYNPLLVVTLMIKNEEKVINATLEPFIKAGIKDYFIFDTGSTDNTINVVKDYFNQNNVKNGHIAQEPFIDFSTSRNRALDLTEEKFPNAAFILMIDAEWYAHNVEGLLDFCKKEASNLTRKAYLIRVISYPTDFYHCRLIRKGSNSRFMGVVHEVIPISSNDRLPKDIYLEYKPTSRGIEATQKRWVRDRELLLKDHNKNPENSRTTFYLAQTFEGLNDLHNAYKYYELRSHQPGWDEENYETFYRLARVSDSLSKIDEKFTWQMAMDYYLKAYQLRPHRAEPLIKIAEHYWPENIPTCFLFAKMTKDLPYPQNEVLFVDKQIYDYTRHEILSKSAWHAGEYSIGKDATMNAIKAAVPHLYHNLMCYLEKLQQNELTIKNKLNNGEEAPAK